MKYLGIDFNLSNKQVVDIKFNEWRNEFFKRILGYETRYLISSYGRVISLKSNGKRLEIIHKKSVDGYYSVQLIHKKSKLNINLRHHKQISVLVAQTFLPKTAINQYSEKIFANHKDLNPSNNHFLNLEWVNSRENKTHGVRTTSKRKFTSRYTGVSKSKKRFRADIAIGGKKILLGRFVNEIDAANAYNDALIQNGLINRYRAPIN